MLHLHNLEILICNFSAKHLLKLVQLRRKQCSVEVSREAAIDGSRSADLIPASDMLNFNSHCNQVASC